MGPAEAEMPLVGPERKATAVNRKSEDAGRKTVLIGVDEMPEQRISRRAYPVDTTGKSVDIERITQIANKVRRSCRIGLRGQIDQSLGNWIYTVQGNDIAGKRITRRGAVGETANRERIEDLALRYGPAHSVC